MTPTITLARHIPTGDIIHIRSADNGLKCNCECVECREKLEAIQGPLRTWHFRHNTNTTCLGGQESALHEVAKQILKTNKQIRISADDIFEYQNASIEKPIDKYKADIVVSNSEKELVIEIAVTHFIEKDKEDYFKQNKIQSIEIDLSEINRQMTIDDLEKLLINELYNKRTIYSDNKTKDLTENKTSDDSYIQILTIAVLGFFGLTFLFKKRRR